MPRRHHAPSSRPSWPPCACSPIPPLCLPDSKRFTVPPGAGGAAAPGWGQREPGSCLWGAREGSEGGPGSLTAYSAIYKLSYNVVTCNPGGREDGGRGLGRGGGHHPTMQQVTHTSASMKMDCRHARHTSMWWGDFGPLSSPRREATERVGLAAAGMAACLAFCELAQ